MKKVILCSVIGFAGLFSANAQEQVSKNTLGLRLGSNDGFGYEISYQRALDTKNRLEIDLGWRDSNYTNAVKLVGTYQWYWNLEKGLFWYAGVGGGISTWNYDNGYVDGSGSTLLIAGQVGIEYNFDFPLQLSLDFRPELYLNDNKYRDDSFGPDIALGVRYKF